MNPFSWRSRSSSLPCKLLAQARRAKSVAKVITGVIFTDGIEAGHENAAA
jgi:hypothetical protein